MIFENEILIKILASTLIISSGFIYVIRSYFGKIKPSPATWLLLTLNSLVVLLTYNTSGANDHNLSIVLSDFIEPAIVFIIIVLKRNKKISFKKREKFFLTINIIILLLWALMYFLFKAHGIIRFTVYLAVIAEIMAIWPQIESHFQKPENDRPLPWLMTGIGYLLGIFLIDIWVLEDCLIPLLGLIYTTTSIPLFWYRINNKIKGEWI